MLDKFRKEIDNIDAQLIEKLAERFKITRKLGEYKKQESLLAQDITREEEKLSELCIMARECGIDEQMIKDIWQLVMEQVVEENSEA